MMGFLLLLLAPLHRLIAGAALALALIGGAYSLGHHRGAAAADQKWQAAAAAEATRQAAIRAKALDAALSRELKRTAENQALEQQVTDYEQKLAAAAADRSEPGGPKPGSPALCHRLTAADVGELRRLGRGDPP